MSINTFPLATLSPGMETIVRIAYGSFLTLQLLATLPNARRFFSTERYGGYVESSPVRDRWHRPAIVTAAFILWLLCALAILFGFALVAVAAINFALARYFYVTTRWKSILRGMGAPGHMNHWLGALILFLAIAHALGSSGLRAMTILTFRVDFAAIMIAAGIYKLSAGYARGDGFERGLVNPWWGFHATWLRRIPAHSRLFAVLDHCGYGGEIACGIGFLIPSLAPYAAVFLATSFVLIGLGIRLTWLAEMVAVCCVFMIPAGNPVDALLTGWFPVATAPHAAVPLEAPIASGLTIVLAVYLAAMPFAYAGMMWNFYAKRSLWSPVQQALDVWTNFFGLILWRVFTADIVNFFVSISICGPDERNVSEYFSPWSARRSWRFRHVGEFICLASIFTTLKYYPHDPELFRRRLVRYAKTVPAAPGASIVFRYTYIRKGTRFFEYAPVAEFVVAPSSAAVREFSLDSSLDPRAPAERSPLIAGERPGSYAPARAT